MVLQLYWGQEIVKLCPVQSSFIVLGQMGVGRVEIWKSCEGEGECSLNSNYSSGTWPSIPFGTPARSEAPPTSHYYSRSMYVVLNRRYSHLTLSIWC